MTDEPSLSDHEQRILDEIERNLAADDPAFVRHVREGRPTKDAGKLLRLSILGVVCGLIMLFFFAKLLILGVVGFLLMLASIVGLATSFRDLATAGRSPSGVLRDAWRRAEHRMRTRRRDQ